MSDKLKHRMNADRALRDAAHAVVKTDIANVRGDLAEKGVGKRLLDRITVGAVEVFEEAATLADNNRGVLATLVGAVIVWFARNPIIALFSDDLDDPELDDPCECVADEYDDDI